MQILLTILIVSVLIFVLFDAFVTVMSTRRAGPLTAFWTPRVWRVLLFIHERRAIHRVLTLAGPFMLLLSILLWYVLHALCWFLLFGLQGDAVNKNPDNTPANWMETLYFISATVSDLGYGDFVPASFPWTLYSGLMALTSTIIVTTSLSYLLAVLRAAVERRSTALSVFGIGEDVNTFIRNAWMDNNQQALNMHLINIGAEIEKNSLMRLSYPVLKYFHSPEKKQASSRAVLLLSDSLFLMSQSDKQELQPTPSVQRILSSSIDSYIHMAERTSAPASLPHENESLALESLHKLGLKTVPQEQFNSSLQEYKKRRQSLLNICREEGWPLGIPE